MKTMKNLILILTFIFGLTLTSCSKYDDFLPEQNDQITKVDTTKYKNKYCINADINIRAKVFLSTSMNYYEDCVITIHYNGIKYLTNNELEYIKTNNSINIIKSNTNEFKITNVQMKYNQIFFYYNDYIYSSIINQLYDKKYILSDKEDFRDVWQFFYYYKDDESGSFILTPTDNVQSFEITNINIHRDY